MSSKLKTISQKTAKIMLLFMVLSSCVSPYQYAYKASQAEKRHLETIKKQESEVKHD